MTHNHRPATVLVVDDDEGIRWSLCTLIQNMGLVAVPAGSGREALAQLSTRRFGAAILDLFLPDMGGHQILQQINAQHTTPVVVLTGQGNLDHATNSLLNGAAAYLTKPVDHDLLRSHLRGLLAAKGGLAPAAALTDNRKRVRAGLLEAIGAGPYAQRLMHAVCRAAETELTVLLTGETGTGKELVAETIHRLSARAQKPFVSLDCSTLPRDLIEAALFGHAKGAYTGAATSTASIFESAEGGTIVIDEMQNLPVDQQAKLLRLIEKRELIRLGETHTRKVNVRVIAATNLPLDRLVAQGAFRRDLFFRLEEFPIALLPLDQHKEDIPSIARHFVNEERERLGPEHLVPDISEEGFEYLKARNWPGNVRELRNVIRRAIALNLGGDYSLDASSFTMPRHLNVSTPDAGDAARHDPSADPSQPIFGASDEPRTDHSAHGAGAHQPVPLKTLVRQMRQATEREIIEKTLKQANYNKALAARMLGIDNKTLYKKLKDYGATVAWKGARG